MHLVHCTIALLSGVYLSVISLILFFSLEMDLRKRSVEEAFSRNVSNVSLSLPFSTAVRLLSVNNLLLMVVPLKSDNMLLKLESRFPENHHAVQNYTSGFIGGK